MPYFQEEEEVRRYVLEHKLLRPKSNFKLLALYFFIFEAIIGLITTVLYHTILKEYYGSSFKVWEITCSVLNIIFAFIFLSKISIFCIEIYQHYAPEHIRRRCSLMPTCSEYAIIAIRKYGAFLGLYKTYIRLTKKCTGEEYRIDNP